MMLTSLEVPASEVREGDWVQWPAESDTIRKINACRMVGTTTATNKPIMMVEAYSEYDAHEYEWLSTQPVIVWRETEETTT